MEREGGAFSVFWGLLSFCIEELGFGTDWVPIPVCFFFVLVIFSIQSRSPCFIHNIYDILFSGSASVWNYGLAYFEVEKALLWHLHESAFEIKKNYFPKTE